MHGCEPFFEKELGKVLAVDIQRSDEATHLVRALNVNLDIPLHAAPVCEIVRFLPERFRLLRGIARRARGTNAREDEGQLGVFARDEDREAGS